MSQFVPKEDGVPIRQPSTANLMLDSADRNLAINPSANDFTISRSNSILNGFFTRVGTTELVLEWLTPNFSPTADAADTWGIAYTAPSAPTPGSGNIPSAFFTQADLIDYLLRLLNITGATTTPATTWSIVAEGPPSPSGVAVTLVPNQDVTIQLTGTLASRLRLPTGALAITAAGISAGLRVYSADLRLYRYLDFVSSQLTYNQALKDASTAAIVRDVLARWYFAFDQPPTEDQYGFPILMGYTPFVLRRTFSPPKQIRWESNIPIGNLAFQVYQPSGELALMTGGPLGQSPITSAAQGTNWLMTLQVSEI